MINLEIERKIWKIVFEKSFLIFIYNFYVIKFLLILRKDWYSLKFIKNWESYFNKVYIF